jgi:signal transduction histidine kinase
MSDTEMGACRGRCPMSSRIVRAGLTRNRLQRGRAGHGHTVVRELIEAHAGNVVASNAGSGLGSRSLSPFL